MVSMIAHAFLNSRELTFYLGDQSSKRQSIGLLGSGQQRPQNRTINERFSSIKFMWALQISKDLKSFCLQIESE